MFDELAGGVVFALAGLAQRVGAAYPVAARVVAALALYGLGRLAPGQACRGALGYGAALGVAAVGGNGAVGGGGAGQVPASVAPAAGAAQRVGVEARCMRIGCVSELTMSNCGQTCSQQCKAYCLGNACNDG